MSISATSVPPWKQNLLEKKRRQEEETRRLEKEEVDKFSSLPNWKRDLLRKRQGQKNSLVFVGRKQSTDDSPERKYNDVNSESSVTDVGHTSPAVQQNVCNHIVIEPIAKDLSCQKSQNHSGESSGIEKVESQEHLPPLRDNPWLRADPIKKKRFSDTTLLNGSYSSENDIVNHSSWSGEVNINNDMHNDTEDNVFEEVTYGKGFVHKLLKKFSHLSENEERGRKWSRKSSSRRSQSAENILDDRSYSSSSHRELSPSGSYCDSLSPRSPSRSRSTDSISSPRPSSDDNTHSTNKMVVADKSGLSTSVYNSQDKEQHSSVVISSGTSLLSPSWENISEPEDELPKKNIVASTRNVFENIAGPKTVYNTPSQASNPVRSPRNSVHSLIAVETSDGENQVQQSSNPSVQRNNVVPTVDRNNESRVGNVVDKTEQVQQLPRGNCDRQHVLSTSEKDRRESTAQSVSGKSRDAGAHLEAKLDKNRTSTGPQSYYEKYFKPAHSTSETKLSSSTENNVSLPNGDINGDLGDKTDSGLTDTVSTVSSVSYKKRKAPPPPKPAISTDKASPSLISKPSVDNTRDTSTSYTSTSSTVKQNGVLEHDSDTRSKLNSESISNNVGSETKQTITKTTSAPVPQPRQNYSVVNSVSASDAKRQNLSLNLNEVNNKKPEVVKSSTGSSNDAYSVINSNRNKKAKIVTPKSSSGPGSLLIRPASNMIQAKNAQFAKLDVKYDDIRTGDFAPPKKKPSHYDDDSDTDEDIPVTNIDDVITGDTKTGSKTPKDKNANIAKKTGKYEFIGAGVISGKSSLSKRPKSVKLSIQFDEHNCITYEYPSEISLMSETPARPGDYDYVDANMVNGVGDDDSTDDETMTIGVEQVTNKSLKSTPAVGSSGSLSGYQSKMQFEYHFGMNMSDEPVQKVDKRAVTPEMTENEFIKPADEEETANWSQTQTTDLLF